MKKLLILCSAILLASLNTAIAQKAIGDHSSMVQFKTLDGTTENAFYIPSDSTTGNVLIIFHEQWGLNNDVKKEAEKWKGELGNVDVYAIDMYTGRVTADPAIAAQYAKELDAKHGDNIIKGLYSKIGPDKRIITLGWGAGASWAFRAAMLAGDRGIGCIMYYGTPEKDEKNIRGLHADVVYNWASRDTYVQRAFVDDFERKVERAGRKFEMHAYNADHSFADPSYPSHDAVLTAEADKYGLTFIKAKFQIE